MDEIFNKKPWIAPASTLDSANPILMSSEEDHDDENNVLSSTKTKLPIKRKYYTYMCMYICAYIIEFIIHY